ncbi:MAG: hypothetical protein U1E36_09910 [Rickettsiales bacterium]
MREAYHVIKTGRTGQYSYLVSHFFLMFFALLSFLTAIGFAAIAVQYVNLPAEYADFLTNTIACKASGITALLGLGLVCFASINRMKH